MEAAAGIEPASQGFAAGPCRSGECYRIAFSLITSCFRSIGVCLVMSADARFIVKSIVKNIERQGALRSQPGARLAG